MALSVNAGVKLVQVNEGTAQVRECEGEGWNIQGFPSLPVTPPKQLLLVLSRPVIVRNNGMKNAQQGREVSDRTIGMDSVARGRQGLRGTNS